MEPEPEVLEMTVQRDALIEIEKQKAMQFFVDRMNYEFMFDPVKKRPPLRRQQLSQLENVVTNPLAIFSGLKRTNFEDGLCYVGPIDGDETRSTGYVFAAFAKLIDRGILFYDWEHRPSDRRNPDLPNNWRIDLGELLWSL